MTVPRRPVLRYHGGKWRLAPWIIGFFPDHRIYVEPFGGGASVLMRKPRAYAEVYNDLDAEVVNVFRVLRNPTQAAELERLVRLTPYARSEFDACYDGSECGSIETARRTIIKSFCGFTSGSIHDTRPRGMRTRPSTGFRGNSNRSGTTPAHDWANYPDQIVGFVERLQGCVVECRDAQRVIEQHDSADTLHYCDPPYPFSTRSAMKKGRPGMYQHEMTDDDHRSLAALLRSVRGMVVLSGYGCDLYDLELYPDWERLERKHLADGARERIEVVWLNAACAAALKGEHHQHPLFEVPA